MLRLFRVHGHSMTPDYQDGDLVLVLPAWWDKVCGRALQSGDDVIARHPGHGVLLKRVDTYSDDGLHLTGLSSLSTAPEYLRLTSAKNVIGRVVWSFA